MDLDDLIVSVYCLLDDELGEWLSGESLRQRGPAPKLSDAEVLTIEAVGEYLGFSQDKAIFGYFRHHYAHFFPALGYIRRTTFVRQAADLWKAKECLWQRLLSRTRHVPVLARAPRFSAGFSGGGERIGDDNPSIRLPGVQVFRVQRIAPKRASAADDHGIPERKRVPLV